MASLASRAAPLGSTPAVEIDYEHKLWGAHEVEPTPRYLGGLKLKYCLEDLEGVTGKVLEIGCGGGGMTRAIKRHRPDLQVYGLDLSSNALGVASQAGRGVTYAAGNAHVLPIASESYDAVVMLDVLEHLPDPSSALAEVRRILKPDGIFHLYCPLEGDVRNLHGILYRLGWRAKERLIGHIQQFSERQLLELLAAARLRLSLSRWSGHFINQLADVAYFSSIKLIGNDKPISVEGSLDQARDGAVPGLLRTAKDALATASYWESIGFSEFPGSGVHVRLEAFKSPHRKDERDV